MSTAQQQIVGVAGVGLLAANVWHDKVDFAGLWGTGDLGQAHAAAKRAGIALAGIAGLTLLAGASPKAGNAAVAGLLCLWIVWLAKGHGSVTTKSNPFTPGQSPKAPTTTRSAPA